MMLSDSEFRDLVESYLDPPYGINVEMARVSIMWERDSTEFGSRHIRDKHDVTEQEVEQVLTEVPPYVEARRHPQYPNRTIFWGATRYDRWLVVVCEDWTSQGIRRLKPITAFEPTNGAEYWERLT